jgi:hypothetical protein
MRSTLRLIGLLLLAGQALTGCGGNDSNDYVDTALVYARAVNAMVDSPAQSYLVGPVRFVPLLPYGSVSSYSVFASFDTSVDIQGLLPDFSRFDIDTVDGLRFKTGYEYTFVSTGYVDAPKSFYISRERIRRPFPEIYLQISHTSTLQTQLDFYLTAPDEDLVNATPYATLEPGESTEVTEIPEGQYRIRIVRTSDGVQIYDSGLLEFFRDQGAEEGRGGRDWFFCIVDGPTSVQWPVYGQLTDGANVFTVPGGGATSSLRVRQAATTIGPVDALIDGDTTDPLATNLGYLESSNFRALVPDEYEVALTTPGQPADVLLQDTVGTTPGDEFALNIIDSEGGPYGVLQNENRRSVITEGRLSIVVGAPENEMVSVWLGYPGDIDVDNGDYGNLAVNKAVPPVTTSRITRETGSTFVSVTITENGDDTDPTNDVNVLVFGPYEIDLAAGDVITLLLVPPPAGGTGTVEAIVLDDL